MTKQINTAAAAVAALNAAIERNPAPEGVSVIAGVDDYEAETARLVVYGEDVPGETENIQQWSIRHHDFARFLEGPIAHHMEKIVEDAGLPEPDLNEAVDYLVQGLQMHEHGYIHEWRFAAA